MHNAPNARFVLSVEHCGQSGHRIADRAGEFIGPVSVTRDDHDISMRPATGAS